MKRMTPFLLLPFLALACQDEGPTSPMDGPDLRQLAEKPNCEVDPSHPACKGDDDGDPASYTFAYPMTQAAAAELESDCWYPEPGGEPGVGVLNPFGRDFRCPVDVADPVLKFHVMSGEAPVTGGTMAFYRCENVETNEPVRWDLCGVRQRPPYNKLFEAREYQQDDLSDGVAAVTFTDRVVWYDVDHYPNQPEELGWGGFRWTYQDGNKGELKSDWFNIRPYPQGDIGF